MKKSLIALAVLAASGASMAQSSVTLYGIADVMFGSSETGVGAGKVRQTEITSGGLSSSRFGFKGSEDLGGGLKANFQLEQGFNLDNGTQSSVGSAFSRQAWVGVSGGFGEVQLGHIWTAYDDVSASSFSAFDSKFSATNEVFVSHRDYAPNPGNGIRYTSPNLSGFSAAVSYTTEENKTPTLSTANTTAFNIQYANGPLAAAVAYQTEEPQGNSSSNDFTRVGGSYDFGVVKLLATYGNVDAAGVADTDEYHVGLDFPVSSNLTLSAGYATSETENSAGAKLTEREGYGLAATYALSKRTTAYAGMHRSTEENSVGTDIKKATLYAVGIKHAF